MTKSEIYLAAINGEYTGMLPKPNTKIECYLYKIATEGISGGGESVGIVSCEQTKTSSSSNGENIFTFTMTDGTTREFKVKNGKSGTTPYIGTNGNWYVDEDTGVPATLSKQSIEIRKIPKSHGVDILIESASELSDLHAKKIFRYGGKVLIGTDHNIEIYDELPGAGSEYSGSSLGRITFTNVDILVKKMEFIYDARNANALLVYVLGTDNKLYFGTIDTALIESPTYQEIYLQTMPGLIDRVVDDLCVYENKVYVLVDAQVIRFPSVNGDPQNSTAVSNIGSESATKIYSDNQYVYLESADGQATIVRPPELDNNEATCITPFVFREGLHNVGKITNCSGKLVGIDYDTGTVVWAKNDMEQVFEIPEDANAVDYEYVDGMFKVFPFMFPDILGSTDVHTTDIHRTDNFLLVIGSGQGYLYRLNPMTLLGKVHLQIDQNNEILQCFENGSYIYIVGTTQIQKIPFITETRTLHSII